MEQVLFLAAPLALLALMMLAARLAISRGWIILRREPTPFEVALNRFQLAMDQLGAEFGRSLLPVMKHLADELEKWRDAQP